MTQSDINDFVNSPFGKMNNPIMMFGYWINICGEKILVKFPTRKSLLRFLEAYFSTLCEERINIMRRMAFALLMKKNK